MHFIGYKESQGLQFKDNIRKFSNSEVLKHSPMLCHVREHTIPQQSSFNPINRFLPLITHSPEKPQVRESHALGCTRLVGSNEKYRVRCLSAAL